MLVPSLPTLPLAPNHAHRHTVKAMSLMYDLIINFPNPQILEPVFAKVIIQAQSQVTLVT